MKFTLEMQCDNAAFEDYPGQEIARILEWTARNVRDGATYLDLYDENGNHVGVAEIRDEE